MDATTIARGLGIARAALGVALIAAPERTTRRWIGLAAVSEGTKVVVRGVGARDIALGLGMAATAGGAGGARWAEGAIVADLADAVSTAVGRDPKDPGVAGVIGLAAGSALLGLWLRGRLD